MSRFRRALILIPVVAAVVLGASACDTGKHAGSASMSCSELFSAQTKALREGNRLDAQANMRMIQAKGC